MPVSVKVEAVKRRGCSRRSVEHVQAGNLQETDCKGGITHTEWCDPCTDGEDRLHPRAFKPEEVSHAALGALREERGDKACNVSAALGWAADGFVTAARLAAGQQCGSPPTYRCALHVQFCSQGSVLPIGAFLGEGTTFLGTPRKVSMSDRCCHGHLSGGTTLSGDP